MACVQALTATASTLRVEVLKYDGTVSRWWETSVEGRVGSLIVTFSPPGQPVFDRRGNWATRVAIRAYYWLDRPYNLLETFRADGTPDELFINVASPASLRDGILTFYDYELDVVKRPGLPAAIVDEDEFEAARQRYGYPPELVAHCRAVAQQACRIAESWTWSQLEDPALARFTR